MLSHEQLAYWYLRLNGFLTLPNVMIHPEVGRDPKGEIDVLGVRFPHRSELLMNPMEDEARFTAFDKPLIVLGEVTPKGAKINETWRDPSRRNMERILHLVGAFPLHKTPEIAAALYSNGRYTDEHYCLSALAFGEHTNSALAHDLPGVMQITWQEVATFIHGRFYEHRRAKHSHAQWDRAGQTLWRLYERHRADPDEFYASLVEVCGLREAA